MITSFLNTEHWNLLNLLLGRTMPGKRMDGLTMATNLHCPQRILPRGRMMRGQEIGLMMGINQRFPQQEAPHGARELSVNISSLYWSTFLFCFFSPYVYLAINFTHSCIYCCILFLPLYLENVERSLLLVQPGRVMPGKRMAGLTMAIPKSRRFHQAYHPVCHPLGHRH